MLCLTLSAHPVLGYHRAWIGGGGGRGGAVGRRAAPLAAALTDVGLLPGVLAHMGDERAGLGEGFAAHHALAWLLTWGRRQQPGQDVSSSLPSMSPRRPREAHPPTRVNANVPLQGAGVSELPLAVDAHVGFLPAVDPQVPLQVPCGETKGRLGRGWGACGGAVGEVGGRGPARSYLRW